MCLQSHESINHGEAVLYPSVIKGGRLLEAVSDLGQKIYEGRPSTARRAPRTRTDNAVEKIVAFYVDKEQKHVVVNYLLAGVSEYTERTMDSVRKEPHYITVKFLTKLHNLKPGCITLDPRTMQARSKYDSCGKENHGHAYYGFVKLGYLDNFVTD
jgi:hypothetical protein